MVTACEQRWGEIFDTGSTTCTGMHRKGETSSSTGSRSVGGKTGDMSGCLLSKLQSILPCELSKLISEDDKKADDLVLIDCQSFMEYSSSHITGAYHLNCTGMLKRRLTQGKLKVHDLFSSAQGKERFLEAKTSNRPVIVYDNTCDTAEFSSSSKPITLVTKFLLNEGTNTLILQGGLREFVQHHQNLCESVRKAAKDTQPDCVTLVGATEMLSTQLSKIECPSSVADCSPVSEIIPFLYIGNKISASDETLINKLNIKYVLNVTKDHPNYFENRPELIYKKISVNDSNKEDIGVHFEEALQFVDEGRRKEKGVLVHCQAGISRSATIVIAYLMKHERLTLNDAYKLVKEKRPVISPNLNFMGSLLKFEKTSLR